MQTNENVAQAKPVARLPEMDKAPIARRPMLETRAKRPNAAPYPATAKRAEVAVRLNRNPRRFGAGF